MNIPGDMLKRLAALGEDPAQFSTIYETRGAAFFQGFLQCYLERREESDSLFRQWSPKLRQFAARCRSSNKFPETESLTVRERAKLPIYEAKIRNAERLRPRNGGATIICCTPLLGIPVAQRLWPGEDSLSIIITPEELSRWWASYKHPEEAYWWWIYYWWRIDDPPDRKSIRKRGLNLKLPNSESPWLVESGLQWGPMAGGAKIELWSWNGKEARFARQVGHTRF